MQPKSLRTMIDKTTSVCWTTCRRIFMVCDEYYFVLFYFLNVKVAAITKLHFVNVMIKKQCWKHLLHKEKNWHEGAYLTLRNKTTNDASVAGFLWQDCEIDNLAVLTDHGTVTCKTWKSQTPPWLKLRRDARSPCSQMLLLKVAGKLGSYCYLKSIRLRFYNLSR